MLTLRLTHAGRTALINANSTGTAARQIVSAGFTATYFEFDEEMTELPDEIKRLTSVSGSVPAPDLINVVVRDESNDIYTARGVCYYLDDGTLFAAYSQEAPFLEKTAISLVHLQGDIQITDAGLNAENISFGDFVFSNPVATVTTEGKVRIATLEEALAGELSGNVVINPLTFNQVIALHNVPIGTVILYSGLKLPAGYLRIGTEMIPASVYTEYAQVVGDIHGSDSNGNIALPKATGRFPRILDPSNPEQSLGSTQEDMVKKHSHGFPFFTTKATAGGNLAVYDYTGSIGRNTVEYGGDENRPPTINLHGLVKVYTPRSL